MTKPEPKYKNVDKWVYGEVKEIELIGYNSKFENEKYYFVFWRNHNDEFDEAMGDCLESTDQNMILLDSPHFCKKVYNYLNPIGVDK